MKRPLSIDEINARKPTESRLFVTEYVGSIQSGKNKSRIVKATCICGIKKEYFAQAIVSGHTKSCGCLIADTNVKNLTKYHPRIPILHSRYKHIMERCYNPNNIGYKNYGGRGVIVCEEWKNNYQNFLTWCLENGWKQELHIDKDKKANGLLEYSPRTVSFLTPNENHKYRRKPVKYKHYNIRKPYVKTTENTKRIGFKLPESTVIEFKQLYEMKDIQKRFKEWVNELIEKKKPQ